MIIFSNTKYFKTVSLIQEIKRFSEYILQNKNKGPFSNTWTPLKHRVQILKSDA